MDNNNNDKMIKVLTIMLSAVKGADRSKRVSKIVQMMTMMVEDETSMIYRIEEEVARFRNLLSTGKYDGWYWEEKDSSKLQEENRSVAEQLKVRFAWLLTN